MTRAERLNPPAAPPGLRDTFALAYDPGDAEQGAWAWAFACAGALYREGHDVPAEWHYRPGLAVEREPDPEEDPFEDTEVLDALRAGHVTAAELVAWCDQLITFAEEVGE